ncbi:CBS domain-containing protein [Rhodobacter sp. KR11]|uniref:CBS domain-containing protein n=1 Tax=Rhodobacter sp. KR11 TaxID=2974588 RepID=UPI002222263C|nr:CBS domain-containing protein [Rhodobacter sp. KR11]MCW1919228.1 CBS domain-containing protein [Rhodobacter sp. KR11]
MNAHTVPKGFREIIAEVDKNVEPTRTVRVLLSWFDAKRRRDNVVSRIKAELAKAGLCTDPYFGTAWIDAEIVFKKVIPPAKATSSVAASAIDDIQDKGQKHLVRMLAAANRKVVSVAPSDTIAKAITLMMSYDFSQLPVIEKERDLRGVISWKTIGSRISQGKRPELVSEVMDQKPIEVYQDDDLAEVTPKIIKSDYVFVRAKDKKIVGIVTATDLSERFQELSEPFLLIGQIEHHIRLILMETFDTPTLRDACFDGDAERKEQLTDASQMTFGEYKRVLEKPENWDKLKFNACRKTFCEGLDSVRELRNSVLHFHPDQLEETELETLRQFLRLLEGLRRLSR